MTYEDFVSYYLSDRIPGQPASFGVGGLDVGHVGIIEMIDRKPSVIEAMAGFGVRRISYEDWLRSRPGELFWVGRLKGVPLERRGAAAERAAEQIGKPYNFWDFDLEDASCFYCSKLAWLSIMRGAGFPPGDVASYGEWFGVVGAVDSRRQFGIARLYQRCGYARQRYQRHV
jgi:uncharacterized protein YycO